MTEDISLDIGASSNILLSRLTAEDKQLIQPHLQRREIHSRDLLERKNRPIKAAYFIEKGLVAIMGNTLDGHTEELGLVGRSGMTGLSLLLGVDQSPHDALVLIPGSCLRIERATLWSLMELSPSLKEHLCRYLQAFIVLMAQTALVKSNANVKIRLARWILMAHDRIHSNELPITHELLSILLGVRRPGVTVALHELEAAGLIHSMRGWITITDREGLEELTGGYYGLAEAEYERLIGVSPYTMQQTSRVAAPSKSKRAETDVQSSKASGKISVPPYS